jgi:NET1-associated nuclear protein 1 (U3 small nucleolar RNA-associated protein 17)
LIQWDWESDTEVTTWAKFQGVISFEVTTIKLQDGEHMAIFLLRERKDGRRAISVSLLEASLSEQKHETNLFESTKAVSRLKVIRHGQCLVACSSQNLIVGTPKIGGSREALPTEFTWTEVPLPCKITSLDVREAPISVPLTTHTASSDVLPSIDIAIGEYNGSILIYRDIIKTLHRNESVPEAERKGLPLCEQLHWHREAVSSLAWSLDGM